MRPWAHQPEGKTVAKQYDAPPELTIEASKDYRATLDTTQGPVTIELDAGRAPLAVNNFVFLARDGYYDGVTFHRVVPGFVIQAGDPTATGRGGPGYQFRDETEGEAAYSRGTVAMANSGPNTNGSQFFICLDDVPLPHAYTIFGAVSSGMDAVDAVTDLPREGEKPTEDAIIRSVTINEE
ncbi:MAG: peptidylprolyl isomerase [Acidimicrobiia bacterium]|nr:peptidylprolyl isomerase [Acidimicrobiia bacterium]